MKTRTDPERYHRPAVPDYRSKAERQREEWDELLAFVTARGGWIISPPMERTVRIETLPGSLLAADLAEAGYTITHLDEIGQRILPHAIVTRMTLTSSGALETMTEGSTKPVITTITHAGVVETERFEAITPPA